MSTTERERNKKTALTVSKLNDEISKRPHNQHIIWDSKQDGLCVLVSRGPEGGKATVTFRVCFYLKSLPGKPQYVKLGRYPDGQYEYPYKDPKGQPIVVNCSDIDEMRRAASDIRNRAKTQDIDPRRRVASNLFENVVKEFIELHASKARSVVETQRIFDRYVLPYWKHKIINTIDRAAVRVLLDKIEKGEVKYKGDLLGSEYVASATLVQISKLFNWHAARSNDFTSPIVKGMKRGTPVSRTRVLSDDELRALWPLLDGVFGAVVKTALLTAQRFHKVSTMKRSDLKARLTIPRHRDPDSREWLDDVVIDNVWDASRGDDDPKNKQVATVPLSPMALRAIGSAPDLGGDFVFSFDGKKSAQGFGRYKRQLDTRLKAALAARGIEFRPWQYRDLRRTAKTLMKRAGVSREISELCLAHVIRGVEGVYDRYDYLREKRHAFEELAALVDRLVNPPDNVVPMTPTRPRPRAAR